jgi:Fic family protein
MNQIRGTRSGRYVLQPGGYRTFIPAPLLPVPPLIVDGEMQVLLSAADRAIGRLDAATELLPNPDLFVAMYVRREAVFSSQIEGTEASLVDLLEFEAQAARKAKRGDVHEVVNYVRAVNYGLARLKDLPLSLRLIREIHVELLRGVRGGQREPGEFRRSQNWIGPPGCSLSEATFVPPPPQEILSAMGELERFLHEDIPTPPLIKCGLAHAQFETIHPFLDGNGRMGRLLITFLLCWRGILKRPLLYISHYFKRHRQQYYDSLQRVRDHDDWEGWMRFFLKGVQAVALEATETARRIQSLREQYRDLVARRIRGTGIGFVLLDYLFEMPIVSVKMVAQQIGRSYPVANDLVATFTDLGLLRETTKQRRNRIYSFQPYVDLFEESNSLRGPS